MIAAEKPSKMILTACYYQRPTGKVRVTKPRWVAVFSSVGGTRVKHIDLNENLSGEDRDKARELAEKMEKEGVYWQSSVSK